MGSNPTGGVDVCACIYFLGQHKPREQSRKVPPRFQQRDVEAKKTREGLGPHWSVHVPFDNEAGEEKRRRNI